MYRVMLGVLVAIAIVALPQILLAHDGEKSHSDPCKIYKKLKEADKNNDGKWSKEEAPGRMKENFDKLDTNSDGFVDKEELKAAFKARMEKAGKKKAHGDKCKGPKGSDHKGHGKKDYKHHGHHGHGVKDKGHHGHKGHGDRFKRLKEADKNNDGKWSKEEAPGHMKENFDKLDTNSDGFVDKEELKAAFKARMEQHRKQQCEGSQSK